MRPPTPRPPVPDDDDATIEVRPAAAAAPGRARARWPWLLGAVLVVAVGGGAAVLLLRPAPTPVVVPVPPPPVPQPPISQPPISQPPVPQPPVTVPPPVVVPPAPVVVAPPPVVVPPPPAFALQAADEATILADPATQLTLFRFAPQPQVVVLDFPALEQQGRMLNRVATLEEKAGQPHDRVLNDTELDAAIRLHGDTVATYYYGHDYPAAALARFFALADRDHIALGPEEERLRALMRQLGWFEPNPKGALISLSRQGADPDITPAVRAAILHHELSHGVFFAEPAYAEYVRHFWHTALTAPEREAVAKFLGSEDYDTADATLMVNEMQAYLMFTYDPHFFLPSNVGMTAARLAALQLAFRRDLPVPWLREAMLASGVGLEPPPPAVVPAAAAAPAPGGATRALTSPASAPRPPAATHH